MYLNDVDDLVIQVVEKNVPEKLSNDYFLYQKVMSVPDSYIVESVSYSYEELDQIKNFIFYLSQKKNLNNITFIAVDEKMNRVIIGFEQLTRENIIDFKEKVMDSPIVVFQEEGIIDLF